MHTIKYTRLMLVSCGAVLAALTFVSAQRGRLMSPAGSSAAQVGGQWVASPSQTYTLGGRNYVGGKWIDITYGRPLERGRDLWGAGATYGHDALVGAKIWRAGADVTTQLTTEVPLTIGTTRVAPGTYTVFVDLKERQWTFVLSTLTAQKTYDPKNTTDVWGGYNYVPDKDVVRVPMSRETMPHAFEQLSWEFVDMTNRGGTLALLWDRTMATIGFTVAS